MICHNPFGREWSCFSPNHAEIAIPPTDGYFRICPRRRHPTFPLQNIEAAASIQAELRGLLASPPGCIPPLEIVSLGDNRVAGQKNVRSSIVARKRASAWQSKSRLRASGYLIDLGGEQCAVCIAPHCASAIFQADAFSRRRLAPSDLYGGLFHGLPSVAPACGTRQMCRIGPSIRRFAVFEYFARCSKESTVSYDGDPNVHTSVRISKGADPAVFQRIGGSSSVSFSTSSH